MAESRKEVKVLDCRASDNPYLHKDFHGALCYIIGYLDDNFGPEATVEYLEQVARTYYAPLAEELEKSGLAALERHWRKIFQIEGGEFSLRYEDGRLVLTVSVCPAIAHLKEHDWLFTERFCETTAVVNASICRAAGYECSCRYEPGRGKCVQKFWKAKG